ncbi:uncharacterized protein NMK_0965 [Novimethylophilus kurashikiensis]|uniref:DUF2322 family protein n=1 Tax=Novimethylophilus kurashikiensis TaxID=1825523 RepID=A0A2R5F796_9PROT|nr:DUF2322 family protein [Novimethylophilus kurashikiensis]GBG13418.1 uncharacterized protein NMK_0965 [Novimethylophilus kurashikiensis]
MPSFKENLDTFPTIDHLARLELLDATGSTAAVIENKAGSQGSLRLYLHLANQFGSITPEAAKLGCELYAEHTDDARLNRGKHPNIDRLFELIEKNETLTVKAILA